MDTSAVFRNPFELRPAAAKVNFAVETGYFKSVFKNWMSVRQDPTEIRSILFWLLLFLTFMMSIALNLNRNFFDQALPEQCESQFYESAVPGEQRRKQADLSYTLWPLFCRLEHIHLSGTHPVERQFASFDPFVHQLRRKWHLPDSSPFLAFNPISF